MSETSPPLIESPDSAERHDALSWHRGWLGAIAAVLVILVLAVGVSGPIATALLWVAAPAAAGLVLAWRDTERLRTLLVVLWAIGGSLACILAGGVSGPLAVWCLAPIAAATVLGPRRLVAEAAAVALMGAAVAALAQAAGLTPPIPSPQLAFWLGLVALLTTSVGTAAGLVLAQRRGVQPQAGDQAANAMLERLVTEQPHLLMSLDAEGRIGSAFGYAPEGISEGLLLGEGLLAAAEPADRPALTQAIQDAVSLGAGAAVFAPLGSLHCACAVSLRRAADGGLVGVLRDDTVQHARIAALEAAKAEAEQLNTGKSRFLANMSHELRTPLNAIMGFSDMMRARLFGPLTGKYGEYVELIHESGGHLLDLINDVLDMSKIEADAYHLSIEAIDAREPVSAALRLMRLQADEAGISLRGVLPAKTLRLDADPRAVKQIVLNLVSNALKFTPKGGQVTVTLTGYADRAELVVADTGVGVASEDLARLGRPYEQAGDADQRAKGSGLGLSLVRAFAELHGGDMAIESELGEGTSVTVRLPVTAKQNAPEALADLVPLR